MNSNTESPRMKVCSKCEKELPATIDYFHKSRGSKDGLRNDCKRCHGIKSLKHERIECECAICGKEFSRPPSYIKNLKDGRIACGPECRSKLMSLRKTEEIENRLNITSFKDWLTTKYHDEKLNVRDIAEIVYGKRTHGPNILGWMKRFGIEARGRSESVAMQWVDNPERKQYQKQFLHDVLEGRPSHRRLSFEEIKKRYKKYDVKILDRYFVEGYTRLLCECLKCGHEFDKSLANEIKSCPACAVTSKGEKAIMDWAKEKGCTYKTQYKIDECRNEIQLPFDFAVFHNGNLEYLIEFDGEQHYRPVDFFGGEKEFKKRKRHDKIKNQYCKNHGIPLIRIPYWDFDKVEEILSTKVTIALSLF